MLCFPIHSLLFCRFLHDVGIFNTCFDRRRHCALLSAFPSFCVSKDDLSVQIIVACFNLLLYCYVETTVPDILSSVVYRFIISDVFFMMFI